ncbi:hypothetical protein [Eleftheria terrae]|uniref:hypothetical protein n=1 Tax=Eleftheria terrae TaxID=1597781 RepID=UPI00263A79F3|nr:hypothetical protein [Eleftheria terrae]WKB52326.1 hypothetical protein N7L95_21420 [Eleftheria terrae]
MSPAAPYLLLAAGALWVASAAGAFVYGRTVGQDACEAAKAREERVAQVARDAAIDAAAKAISNITVQHTTVHQKLEHEVRTKTVYRDCRSGPDAVRLFNSTLPGAEPAQPAGSGQLPAANPAH